jgi:hypothetical protein
VGAIFFVAIVRRLRRCGHVTADRSVTGPPVESAVRQIVASVRRVVSCRGYLRRELAVYGLHLVRQSADSWAQRLVLWVAPPSPLKRGGR